MMKREKERKRYAEMSPQSKREKIMKTIKGRTLKSKSLPGTHRFPTNCKLFSSSCGNYSIAVIQLM